MFQQIGIVVSIGGLLGSVVASMVLQKEWAKYIPAGGLVWMLIGLWYCEGARKTVYLALGGVLLVIGHAVFMRRTHLLDRTVTKAADELAALDKKKH